MVSIKQNHYLDRRTTFLLNSIGSRINEKMHALFTLSGSNAGIKTETWVTEWENLERLTKEGREIIDKALEEKELDNA